MYNYYCKNCNNIIGEWNDEYECYDITSFCHHTTSKNIYSISFLDCKKCNKFVGMLCYDVCKNCFGKKEIIGEKNLFNFFLKYKEITSTYKIFGFYCESCDKDDFRSQFWFFRELTFYK